MIPPEKLSITGGINNANIFSREQRARRGNEARENGTQMDADLQDFKAPNEAGVLKTRKIRDRGH